ncbi:MAG TPA: (2Fe-2S)-binding protein [Elusimicrobiota bacterium]|jgi:carbon-monoxide dehydrogenase small subunit|nr:(2Fe-2S)-binding protein [Elusimicrobiota bacterium]
MISLTVNGKKKSFRGAPFTRLIDVLREDLRLTGTKEGCGEGECGACTVLLDGEAVNSCLIPVCSAAGRRIETVESLGSPEKLSSLQASFLECGGAQCGICTPGMLMSAHHHLKSGGKADDASVRTALAGNLCRCTGYQDIVKSVLGAAKKIASKKAGLRKKR